MMAPRFLVFAYACEPDKGSEPGAGWIWSRMIAGLGEAWVITRANNRPVIEEHLATTPERDRLRFVYVDLPERARFWKRGTRGARIYYFLWQAAALRRARKLRRDVQFDAVWHLTWANAWLGSAAALLSGPFIYGPVGGGVAMPWRLASSVGVRGALYELLRTIARNGARFGNPVARLSWVRASLVLVQNPETRAWLPKRHRSKAVVFPHVVLDTEPSSERHPDPRPPFTALFAGRLLPWKGVSLALRAVGLLPDWRLIVCGSGPDEQRLKTLTQRWGLNDRVEFHEWLPREQVLSWMQEADVFVFPSLHDEGGWVIAEAASAGLPVVCLDRGGPPVIGGRGVDVATEDQTVSALAAAMREAAGSTAAPVPTMSVRREDLRELLQRWFRWPPIPATQHPEMFDRSQVNR